MKLVRQQALGSTETQALEYRISPRFGLGKFERERKPESFPRLEVCFSVRFREHREIQPSDLYLRWFWVFVRFQLPDDVHTSKVATFHLE